MMLSIQPFPGRTLANVWGKVLHHSICVSITLRHGVTVLNACRAEIARRAACQPAGPFQTGPVSGSALFATSAQCIGIASSVVS